jgi:hypothetical protein
MLSPGGSEEALQLYGGTPPVAVKVKPVKTCRVSRQGKTTKFRLQSGSDAQNEDEQGLQTILPPRDPKHSKISVLFWP